MSQMSMSQQPHQTYLHIEPYTFKH